MYDSSILSLSRYDSSFSHERHSVVPGMINEREAGRRLNALLYLASAYNMIAEPDNALNVLTRGEEFGKRFPFEYEQIKPLVLFQSGNAFLLMMDFEKATRYYMTSLSLSGSDEELASRIHENLGGIYFFLEDFELAEEQFQKAMILAARTKVNPLRSAELLFDLGSAHLEGNGLAQALGYFLKADSIVRRFSFPDSHFQTGLAIGLGNLYLKMQKYHDAASQFQRASEIMGSEWEANVDAMIQVLTGYGELCNMKGQYDSAVQFYLKACSLVRGDSEKDIYMLTNLFSGMAAICGKAGDWTGSLNWYDRALEMIKRDDACYVETVENKTLSAFSPVVFRILLGRALVLARQGIDQHCDEKIKKSRDEILRVMDYALRLNSEIGREGSRILFNESVKDLYYAALETGYLLSDKATGSGTWDLFLLSDQSRNQVLSSGYYARMAKKAAGVPDSLLIAEEKLNSEIMTCLKRLADPKAERSTEQYLRYFDKLLVSKSAMDSLTAKLERYSPSFQKLKSPGMTITMEEIKSSLKSDEALIEYFTGDSTAFIFVIMVDTLIMKRIPFPQELRQTAERFCREIRQAEEENIHASAYLLYSKLFRPVRNDLKGIRKLVIIPDEVLGTIPFEAFIMNDHKRRKESSPGYLLGLYEISSHFSAGLWVETNRPSPSKIKLSNYSGYAPVNFDWCRSDDWIDPQETGMNPLPYSKDEIDETARLFMNSGGEVKTFTGGLATATNFMENAGGSDIIHIATHSTINTAYPGFTGLIFVPDSSDFVTDPCFNGILFLDEIFNLRLKADLVVLSACATGTGKITRTEGVLAMTRGFFAAGATDILFTLWNVTDRHTRDFMVSFFNWVLKGMNYSGALRQAKMEMIANPSTSLPRTWAPYVLLGH